MYELRAFRASLLGILGGYAMHISSAIGEVQVILEHMVTVDLAVPADRQVVAREKADRTH